MYCRKCRVVDSIFNNKNLAQKTHRRQSPWPFFDSGSTSPAFPKSMLATQGVDKFPLPPWAADNPPNCKCPLPADLLTSPPGWLITRKSQPQIENTHSLSENFLVYEPMKRLKMWQLKKLEHLELRCLICKTRRFWCKAITELNICTFLAVFAHWSALRSPSIG